MWQGSNNLQYFFADKYKVSPDQKPASPAVQDQKGITEVEKRSAATGENMDSIVTTEGWM